MNKEKSKGVVDRKIENSTTKREDISQKEAKKEKLL